MKLSTMQQEKLLKMKKHILRELTTEIMSFDEAYFLSGKWKQKGYTCYGLRQRTLQTLHGVLQYQRRYYRHRYRGGGYYPADIEFDIERYARISIDVKQMIYTSYTEMKVRKIAEISNLSTSSIYNALHRLGAKDIMYQIEPKENITHIFIQADEDHLSYQRQSKQNEEARMIMVYEGRVKECANRYKLVGKHYFLFTSKDNFEQKWEEVYDYIDKKYPNCRTFYLGADGGKWIAKGKEVFTQAHYIYDKFHFVQSLMRIFGSSHIGVEKRFEAYKYIRNGSVKEFRKLAKDWLVYVEKQRLGRVKGRKSELYKINKFMRHIRNNWVLPKYHGTSAEGHISHYLSAHLSSRPKGFSIHKLPSYLKILEYKLNNIDFETYYKAKHRTMTTKYMTDEEVYSDTQYHSNVPALYSNNKSLRKTLRGIVS